MACGGEEEIGYFFFEVSFRVHPEKKSRLGQGLSLLN